MFEVGHVRWSQMVAALAALPGSNEDDPLTTRPLKHCRVDEAAISAPIVMLDSLLAPEDRVVLAQFGRVLHRAIASLSSGAPPVVYLQGHKQRNLILFSFAAFFDDVHDQAPRTPEMPASYLPIPKTVEVGTTRVPIIRELRRHDNEAHSSLHVSPGASDLAPHPTLSHLRILVVGAGGIGCELLKSIVLAGARSITIVDLDTIDATNLNRQFLFRQRHIDASKSHVAVEIMQQRLQSEGCANATSSLVALCANVKDANPMDVTFYKTFDLVLNGLDNMSARKHVNRLCVAANVCLIESGTMGFNGQVQPIVPHVTECYDCRARPSDRPSYAVCTIHARPTSMVHCVHYAKELYERLASAAMLVGYSAEEPATQQASEMDFAKEFVVSALAKCERGDALAANLFHLLFVTKIEQLLSLKNGSPSSWPVAPPIALRDLVDAQQSDEASLQLEIELLVADGRVPTCAENVALFMRAVRLLVSARWGCEGGRASSVSNEGTTFDKQDDLAVLFVSTVANLRAACFHIPCAALEELRSTAGHIVPAIASSNAIIAACIASQALAMSSASAATRVAGQQIANCVPSNYAAHLHEANPNVLKFIFLRKVPLLRRRAPNASSSSAVKACRHNLLLHSSAYDAPNKLCLVCHGSADAIVLHSVGLNVHLYTVGSFVNVVLRGHYAMSSPCIAVGPKVLYEHEEFENLASKPLAEFLLPLESATSLTASDFHQNLEWTLTLTHQPDFNDAAGYSVNGVLCGPIEANEPQSTTSPDDGGRSIVGE